MWELGTELRFSGRVAGTQPRTHLSIPKINLVLCELHAVLMTQSPSHMWAPLSKENIACTSEKGQNESILL